MRIELGVLGPLQAIVDGRVARLTPPKARALLALLALHANEVMPRSRLIDELWGTDPPAAAVNLVQGYVSDLRKTLGREALVTHGQGYLLALEPGALDLERFEQLVVAGRRLLEQGRVEEASARLSGALAIWRGAPLADLEEESFASPVVARLDELRLIATELHAEGELALGHHGELVLELEELVRRHPLRERPRELLMLSLYRAGRQADALAVFRTTRELLSEELGIEPSPALRELERGILQHDPALASDRMAEPRRGLLVASSSPELGAAVSVGALLAVRTPRELIVVRLVADAAHLDAAGGELRLCRAQVAAHGVAFRAAPLFSEAPAADLVRLATEQDVDLLLLAGVGLGDALARGVLEQAPCDVALVTGRELTGTSEAVLVLFGGGANDWAALEIGAWLAGALSAPLRVAAPARGAGRLLASASIAVERTAGIPSEPVLLPADPAAAGQAAAAAAAVVVGVPDEWRSRELGAIRLAAVTAAKTALVVRGGLRPGGLAPRESRTRFTWSLTPELSGGSV